VNYTYLPHIEAEYARDPAFSWRWYLPYDIAIKLAFLSFIFVRGRRVNVAALAALILIFLLPYWHRG
jgi:hypothetical protein